jgi:hypothetical protein
MLPAIPTGSPGSALRDPSVDAFAIDRPLEYKQH